MKKACTALILVSFLGLLSSVLLKLSDHDVRDLVMVSEVIFFTGTLLMPSLVSKKFGQFMLRQKVFLVVLWLGIVLTSAGHVFRYMHWDGYRGIAFAGYSMILVYVLYAIAIVIANKLRINPIGKPGAAEALNAAGLTENDLTQYTGTYVNEKLPLKIIITQNGAALVAQATNQSAFYLEIVDHKTFKYYKRDIVLEFDVEKNEMMLKQHGGYFPFVKEVQR